MTTIVENSEVSRLLDELTTMTGREDPYPRYQRLREISPVVRADDGALVVTHYAGCTTVVRDGRLGHLPTDLLGERVVAYLGAGNRDPKRFADPERLDLTRTDIAPLSFGGDIHYCLGAPLARLEAKVAFPALFRRFPGLELDGEPERRDSLAIRGYTKLSIRT